MAFVRVAFVGLLLGLGCDEAPSINTSHPSRSLAAQPPAPPKEDPCAASCDTAGCSIGCSIIFKGLLNMGCQSQCIKKAVACETHKQLCYAARAKTK